MLDFESQRIRDLREIDFSKLEFEDLRWKYGTFQSVSTGSGRDKKYSSWTGVKTRIGEIEESVWYQAAERLIREKGEQELLHALIRWCSQYHDPKAPTGEARKEALQLHVDRIFDNPRWVGFVPFNRQYRPEVLRAAHLVTVVSECCQEPGVVTKEQIDAACEGAIACPCCGKWSRFTITDSALSPPEHQTEQTSGMEMT